MPTSMPRAAFTNLADAYTSPPKPLANYRLVRCVWIRKARPQVGTDMAVGPHFTPGWPDGRILTHPAHFVNTGVAKVKPNDTLKLRSGPGTRFRSVAGIPANATDLSAFDQDQVWDGDTWWCPVEWRGFRGYVGRSHLPTAH